MCVSLGGTYVAFLMSGRGWLFLLSIAMVLASLAVAGWLLVTGQALSFDGLFLSLTCLVLAFAFGLYAGSLLKQAMKEVESAARDAAPAPAQTATQATPRAVAPGVARPVSATGNPGHREKPAEAEEA
jgi:hypothetical protein